VIHIKEAIDWVLTELKMGEKKVPGETVCVGDLTGRLAQMAFAAERIAVESPCQNDISGQAKRIS
jgi:hypothetical protein